MMIQFVVAMIATLGFAIIYNVDQDNLLICSIIGAIGWIIYYSLSKITSNAFYYPFVAAFTLTLISRIMAVIKKAPATMYLLPGIFPIVPGAGIYNTFYYLFMNNIPKLSYYGFQTIQITLSISFGIIFALAIPQRFFKRR